MKNLTNKILLFFGVAAFMTACTEDKTTVDTVYSDVTRGAILRTLNVVSTEYDIKDMNAPWGVSLEMEDHNEGALLESVDVRLTFVDLTEDNGTNPIDDVFVTNIPASAFGTSDKGLPKLDYNLSFSEALAAAGLEAGEFTGGDYFLFHFDLKLTDGRVFNSENVAGTVSGGSFFKSPFEYRVTLTGCPPRPGIYRIEMFDDYGDGWQTDNPDNGPGITVTADGVLIAEVGLCSIYDSTQAGYCTTGASSGIDYIEIPEGTQVAIWNFPGDNWGEISFAIYGPQDQLVYSVGVGGQSEGEFPVVLCAL